MPLKQGAILYLLLILLSAPSHSALAPSAMNLRDLGIMVRFIAEHQKVADTLEMIDMKNHSVIFDGGCRATFKRKRSWNPLSRPGPQAEIQFKESSCPLGYHANSDE